MVMDMKHSGGQTVRVADELWKGEDRHLSDREAIWEHSWQNS